MDIEELLKIIQIKLTKELDIKFRTTIVIYKGNNEVSRIIGQTSKKTIYSTIQKGI